MATIIKPNELEFKADPSALAQFDLKTLSPRLSTIVNSKHFMFDIRLLEPGKYSFPYHFHRNAEELILILSGSVTIRTSQGLEIANAGEIVFFEMGETGVHQLYNHGNVPCTYMDLKTTIGIDVVEYPDSGKINISPYREIYEKNSQVEYNKGESDVQKIWDTLKNK